MGDDPRALTCESTNEIVVYCMEGALCSVRTLRLLWDDCPAIHLATNVSTALRSARGPILRCPSPRRPAAAVCIVYYSKPGWLLFTVNAANAGRVDRLRDGP